MFDDDFKWFLSREGIKPPTLKPKAVTKKLNEANGAVTRKYTPIAISNEFKQNDNKLIQIITKFGVIWLCAAVCRIMSTVIAR